MNKKFSTLVASLLLAGGLFSTANAQQDTNPKDAGDYYYSFKLHGDQQTVPYDGSWSIAVVDGKLVQVKDNAVTKASAWKISAEGSNTTILGYRFENAEGKTLQFDKNGNYTEKASDVKYDVFKRKGYKLFAVDANSGEAIADKYLIQSGDTYVLGADVEDYVRFYSLPTADVTSEVNDILGDGFEITIGKTKAKNNSATGANLLIWDGAYTLEGNVFTGKLTVEGKKLKKANGKYIVLTNKTWGSLSNSLQAENQEGYIWSEATPDELSKEKIGSTKIIASDFTITQPNAVVEAPLEVKVTDASGNVYELMVATVAGTSYLTTGSASDRLNDDAQLVGAASFTRNAAKNADVSENTYVIFGSGNEADYTVFNDAVWSITRTDADGETLVAGPSCAKGKDWVPASQVNTNYPEGQWLWNGEVFVNRESSVELEIAGLRVNDGVYSDANGYTYTFTKVGEPGSVFLGYYSELTDDQLKQEAFYIGSPIKATGDTVYVAKAENGALYLSADVADAVEFRLTRNEYTGDKANESSALIQNLTTYKSSTIKGGYGVDALNFYTYALADAVTGDVLSYDETNERYMLTSASNAGKDVYNVVLKNKAENLYNLVFGIKNTDTYVDDLRNDDDDYLNETLVYSFCKLQKIYAGQNTAELTKSDAAYDAVANDLFVLTPVSAGQHVSGIYGQNIKLFRDADPNYVLYEEGKLLETKDEVLEGFLGLQNIQDATYADMNPAMYVDSAAGLNTWRPEYMLALDVNVVPAGKYCEIHGANAGCKDEHLTDTEGYIEGRYLVNLVDSVKAGRKDCVYQNYNGADYYRLGFVAAKHIADSLVIASDNKVIELTGNAHSNMKICEFAFHYTDASRSAFTIETAYDNEYTVNPETLKTEFESTQGWIKYHNGVPVVTSQKSEAEVFNLAQTEEEATANETIAASAVTVIAGEGNVTIAGAAGKKVVIANILGQTIANTVLTSDNATIAAPAGVVVVAVEGEAAVKAIVK